MRLSHALPLVLLGLGLGAAVEAGEGKDHHKCTMATQACLDEMASSYGKSGWLGIEYDQDEKTGQVAVTSIVPGSPAEDAKLQKGDVLVALNGISINQANQEKLQAARQKMPAGSKVTYTVTRGGSTLDVPVTLGTMPKEVLARWIGQHMLEHASAQVAAK